MTRVRFLGCGWSHGVPVIGCTCEVCSNPHPRNRRRRPSIQLISGDVSVVVDVGPDFRDQALTFGIRHLDAVFITHAHADHVMGLDDIRRYTWERSSPLGIYADPDTRTRLQELLPYAAKHRAPGRGVPQIEFESWSTPVSVGPLKIGRAHV